MAKRDIGTLQAQLGKTNGTDPLGISPHFQNNPMPSGRKMPKVCQEDLEEMAAAWLTEEMGLRHWGQKGKHNQIKRWRDPAGQQFIRQAVKELFVAKWKRFMVRHVLHIWTLAELLKEELEEPQPVKPVVSSKRTTPAPTPVDEKTDHRKKRTKLDKDAQDLMTENVNADNASKGHVMGNTPVLSPGPEIIPIPDDDDDDDEMNYEGYAATPATNPRQSSSSSAEATDDTKASLRDQVASHQKEHRYQRIQIKALEAEIVTLKNEIKSLVTDLQRRADKTADLEKQAEKIPDLKKQAERIPYLDTRVAEQMFEIKELRGMVKFQRIVTENADLREKSVGLEAEKEQLASENAELKQKLEAPSQLPQDGVGNEGQQPPYQEEPSPDAHYNPNYHQWNQNHGRWD